MKMHYDHRMRKSNIYFAALAVLISLIGLMAAHAASRQAMAVHEMASTRNLVKEYGLTDLCLFSEARYTRHLSLADHHAPFQDGPMSFEHFHSGALTATVAAMVKTIHD